MWEKDCCCFTITPTTQKLYIPTVILFLSSSHPFPPHIAWAARPPCLLKPRREGRSTGWKTMEMLGKHGSIHIMPMMMNVLKICYMLGWTTLASIGDHKHHHLSAHLFSYVIESYLWNLHSQDSKYWLLLGRWTIQAAGSRETAL